MRTRRWVLLSTAAIALGLSAGPRATAQIRDSEVLGPSLSPGKVKLTCRGMGATNMMDCAFQLDPGRKRKPLPPVTIRVDPGTLAYASDHAAQNMVVGGVEGRLTDGFGVLAPPLGDGPPALLASPLPGAPPLQAGMISVVPEPVITVSSTTPVHYVLGVYCAEFEKDNPSSDVTFTFGKVDPVLACITETAARFEGRTIQAAVWIKTDFRDVEPALAHKTIDKKYPLSNREWADALGVAVSCGVLGKEAVNALPEADAAASPASRMPPPLPPGGCCGGPSAAAR